MKEKLRSWMLWCLVSFLLFIVALQGGIVLHAKDTATGEEPVMLILGARLYGTVPSPALVNRLEKGVTHLQAHPDMLVVVAGGMGPGETITEAEAMAHYLVSHGIEENRILLEALSTNTQENIRFSLEKILSVRPRFLDEEGQVVLVTNGFHVMRSKMLARRAGMQPTALAAKTPPSFVLEGYARESLAFIKSFILDR